MSCPFCLSNGLLETPLLAETAQAYLTTVQTSSSRYLIIPKIHSTKPGELPDEWWAEVKSLAEKIKPQLSDYNVSINIGQTAGQRIEHLHFWVIPRQPKRPSSGLGMAALIDRVDEL